MTIAFLAPGQGSRDLAAVIEFLRARPRSAEWFDVAAAAADLPVDRWLERGGRHLEATEILQPVLTAISLVVARELADAGVFPDYVAGHSLGEIAAWAITGSISFDDAIRLAGLRGRLMARAAEHGPGGLLALIEKTDVEGALRIGRAAGWVEFGAENAPDEIILTGEEAALRAIAAVCPARRLPVSGAWHSSAMARAVDPFRVAVQSIVLQPARVKFVLNRDGCVVDDEETVGDCLAEQLVRPVHWSKVLQTLHHAGAHDFVTLGPGAILRALVRKNLGTEVRVWGTDSDSSLRLTLETLGRS
ncbi:MAG TPA: ACP S-malonyltransferase [Polyangium sp.]|nr:ACP S-malonyltransferase [Polyangium sp.]